MSTPIKHHFVPQVYLAKFKHENTLWALEIDLALKYSKVYAQPKSPSSICIEDNFYLLDEQFKLTHTIHENLPPLFVENTLFNRIERNYSKIFDALTTKQLLDYNHAKMAADLILQLKMRNPFHRKELDRNRDKFLQEGVSFIKNKEDYALKFGHIPDFIKDFVFSDVIDQDHNPTVFAKNLQLSSLIDREFDRKEGDVVIRNILSYPWTIIDNHSSNLSFITTDNPGVSVKVPYDEFVYNTLFMGDFKFYLPLSPRYCLFIRGGALDLEYLNTGKKRLARHFSNRFLTDKINIFLMQIYNKYIIASDRQYLNIIADHYRNFDKQKNPSKGVQ